MSIIMKRSSQSTLFDFVYQKKAKGSSALYNNNLCPFRLVLNTDLFISNYRFDYGVVYEWFPCDVSRNRDKFR